MVIGHGIDLCGVARIRRMIADHGDHFLERTYTQAEVAYARRRKKGFEETLAGRFAAKEAVMKALGTGWREGVEFRGIEILNEPSGKPYVVLHGTTAEKARQLGVASWQVTITHTEDWAIASAIAEGPAAPPSAATPSAP
jgi:holo-[acyl-carrier protein] synthase